MKMPYRSLTLFTLQLSISSLIECVYSFSKFLPTAKDQLNLSIRLQRGSSQGTTVSASTPTVPQEVSPAAVSRGRRTAHLQKSFQSLLLFCQTCVYGLNWRCHRQKSMRIFTTLWGTLGSWRMAVNEVREGPHVIKVILVCGISLFAGSMLFLFTSKT